MVHNESRRDQAGTSSDSKHVRDQKQKLHQGRQKSRRETFGDLGVY